MSRDPDHAHFQTVINLHWYIIFTNILTNLLEIYQKAKMYQL